MMQNGALESRGEKRPPMATVVAEMKRDSHVSSTSSASGATASVSPLREGRGFTPSGGSACQQSSRIIMGLLLLLTTALLVAVLQSMFEMKRTFDASLKGLAEWGNSSMTDDFLVDNFTDPELACDAAFFANATEESTRRLISTFELLDQLVLVFAILGTIFATLYWLVKFCVTVRFARHVNREENPVKRYTIATFKPVLQVDGNLETVEQRRTRVFLRSETLCYMFANATLDIPLFTFAMTYYLMRRSKRGIKCAECFAQGEVCQVDSLSDVDASVQAGVFFVVLSLVWNAALLTERWVAWVRYKKVIEGRYFHGTRIAILIMLCLALYAFVVVTPMILLYYYDIGPNYFLLDGEAQESLRVLGVTGMIVWAVAFLAINIFAGNDPWEVLSAPVLACEVCQAAYEETGCLCEWCCCS